MDKAGATIGLLIAALVVWLAQSTSISLTRTTFQTIVLLSLVPGSPVCAVHCFRARDVAPTGMVLPPGCLSVAWEGLSVSSS